MELEQLPLLLGDAVPLAVRLGGAAVEGPLQALELGEAAQGDVDRALQLFRPAVDDVGEDTARCGLVHPVAVVGIEQGDHGTERLGDDLRDLLERVLGALAEPDQRHVGALPRRHGRDVGDVDLAGDHLVTEAGHHLGEHLEPIGPLIRDQDAKVMDPVHAGLP